MNYKIDKELVKESYSRMPDYELIRIATSDAQGLTYEAQEILIEEIRKRGLSENLVNGVASLNAIHTNDDLTELCAVIQSLPCPICKKDTDKLNGIVTVEVLSILVFTHYEKKIKIGCLPCLALQNKNALIKSGTLGWWGIPWGIVRTIQAINAGMANKKNLHSTEPNEALKAFAFANRGVIETYKNDYPKLISTLFN